MCKSHTSRAAEFPLLILHIRQTFHATRRIDSKPVERVAPMDRRAVRAAKVFPITYLRMASLWCARTHVFICQPLPKTLLMCARCQANPECCIYYNAPPTAVQKKTHEGQIRSQMRASSETHTHTRELLATGGELMVGRFDNTKIYLYFSVEQKCAVFANWQPEFRTTHTRTHTSGISLTATRRDIGPGLPRICAQSDDDAAASRPNK